MIVAVGYAGNGRGKPDPTIKTLRKTLGGKLLICYMDLTEKIGRSEICAG